MPKKPEKRDDPEQSKRFIETAEQVGADDEEALEQVFKRIPLKEKEKPQSKE